MADNTTRSTPGVLDDLLSPPNLARLSELSDKLPDCFESSTVDVSSSITSVGDAELHGAILLAVAYISSKAQSDLEDAQLGDLVRSLAGKAIILRTSKKESDLIIEAAVAGIAIASSTHSLVLDKDLLIKLTAVTDPNDPWTTGVAASVASRVLAQQISAERLPGFIANDILESTLKPLFTKHSSRITASGRPSQYATVDDRSRAFSEVQSWRSKVPWAEATIQWTINTSTAPVIKEHWPLFMPVLLALVEDESIEVKAKGLKSLTVFVEKCPAQILQGRGIGRVFADVTFPLLLYLPSVTPENESITIIGPAYDVLIKLAECTGSPENTERRRFFDKILRDGVFAGYHHASQYMRIMQVLIQKTAAVINCMGIYSIKHLSPLLSMSSSIMTDPFAVSYPPTLLATTQLIGAIIGNAWPRIREPEHMENVIRILSLCWLNTLEEIEDGVSQVQKKDLQALSQELESKAKALEALWTEDTSKRPSDLDEALEKEPKLARLFSTASA
ncbi:hypothetical protein NXS19_007633 [Fusarium pseudograminearum]|uniref:Uncharacterized protein n=1 Tax=Fusarium pseudograminearum (strain CS3096) TaxID=1028729 RepID=K3V825_FUSPC|nr:hypothetical protein FPSE_10462 [Fusarium pseudograminearum CS3096]EKJ69349.1 hypothetical protein FPSE_10462 [Fusarium pseudograminearum CS3096]KAF0641475.1 hypothetical protein FPSE5266_10462 [Fusarium pseudograminearum]UZP39817.1 hypothetical protein NXS19_007633 [Fusarium pseudograminearum]